ncbi:MAG: DUF3825 domain-containing protein [Chlorobi bacterium]|nr:DUF3825 domain-containing protein [Chlorobiota bacterium]MCI0717130.1 DUF3825 domain-containing protein [Chlorobiota bacterium]
MHTTPRPPIIKPLFQFAWFPDFDKALNELKALAVPENWDFSPNPAIPNKILYNYVHHTYRKIENEGKSLIVLNHVLHMK